MRSDDASHDPKLMARSTNAPQMDPSTVEGVDGVILVEAKHLRRVDHRHVVDVNELHRLFPMAMVLQAAGS